MHTLYDLECRCLESVLIIEGIIHDKETMKSFVTTFGITYIFDRGYLDYKEYNEFLDVYVPHYTATRKNPDLSAVVQPICIYFP